MAKQFFFGQDESSHWYLVPVEWRADFEELSEQEDGWEDERWSKFEDCRIDFCGHYVFENPVEQRLNSAST